MHRMEKAMEKIKNLAWPQYKNSCYLYVPCFPASLEAGKQGTRKLGKKF